MRILVIIILIDFFVFVLGSIFVHRDYIVYDTQNRDYHMDKYGYYWNVE